MERVDILELHGKLLECVTDLPRKIISIHGVENLPEFVLHHLCSRNCFNIPKAAYFVDNTDFDWFRGLAGFDQNEYYADWDSLWNDPAHFINFVQNSSFNLLVRSCCKNSCKNSPIDDVEFLKQVANELNFRTPTFSAWGMKHGNHGMLVYEKNPATNGAERHFLQSLQVLGLCPTF